MQSGSCSRAEALRRIWRRESKGQVLLLPWELQCPPEKAPALPRSSRTPFQTTVGLQAKTNLSWWASLQEWQWGTELLWASLSHLTLRWKKAWAYTTCLLLYKIAPSKLSSLQQEKDKYFPYHSPVWAFAKPTLTFAFLLCCHMGLQRKEWKGKALRFSLI